MKGVVYKQEKRIKTQFKHLHIHTVRGNPSIHPSIHVPIYTSTHSSMYRTTYDNFCKLLVGVAVVVIVGIFILNCDVNTVFMIERMQRIHCTGVRTNRHTIRAVH